MDTTYADLLCALLQQLRLEGILNDETARHAADCVFRRFPGKEPSNEHPCHPTTDGQRQDHF